jgi:hypothetical protein
MFTFYNIATLPETALDPAGILNTIIARAAGSAVPFFKRSSNLGGVAAAQQCDTPEPCGERSGQSKVKEQNLA